MQELTQARLKELLSYDPETGVFTWLSHRRLRSIGKAAGTITSTGYLQISINCAPYYAHRLAWLYVYGSFPDGHLDHKNINRSDNKINNLRNCTPSQNGCNTKKRSHNSSGFRGVHLDSKSQKFRAQINIAGKRTRIGDFASAEQASAAYQAKAREVHGEFYKAPESA